jgi:hypothetical protein
MRVRTILRSLLLWLVLLAVPFQGFAAATMLPCAPAKAASLAQAHGDHAMHHAGAQPAMRHHAQFQHNDHDNAAHPDHAKGKCASTASCCVGAAMAPALPAGFALAAPPSMTVPFRAGHVPSVHPPVPERPPSSRA